MTMDDSAGTGRFTAARQARAKARTHAFETIKRRAEKAK